MDPSGFDNPHEALVDAREAARILGVKVATLYSYASRRRVRSFPSGLHREKRYLRDDLERLRHLADARLGHEAVAAGALRWGEPVLSSALTEIRPDGPWYRGHAVLELARTARFEAVAELLWNGTLPASPPACSRPRALLAGVPRARGSPIDALIAGLSALRFARRQVHEAGASRRRGPGRSRARVRITGAGSLAEPSPPELVWTFVGLVAAACGRRPADVLAAPTIAGGVQRALGAPVRGARLLEAALVASADHELNVSSFAARVAASTGADLEACLLAALAAFSGPRHGGARSSPGSDGASRCQASATASTRQEIREVHSSSRSPCAREDPPVGWPRCRPWSPRRRGWASECPTSTWAFSPSRTRCVSSPGPGRCSSASGGAPDGSPTSPSNGPRVSSSDRAPAT
jgi:citrate synthase